MSARRRRGTEVLGIPCLPRSTHSTVGRSRRRRPGRSTPVAGPVVRLRRTCWKNVGVAILPDGSNPRGGTTATCGSSRQCQWFSQEDVGVLPRVGGWSWSNPTGVGVSRLARGDAGGNGTQDPAGGRRERAGMQRAAVDRVSALDRPEVGVRMLRDNDVFVTGWPPTRARSSSIQGRLPIPAENTPTFSEVPAI